MNTCAPRPHPLWAPLLTMGLLGAFYWAIRGTGGYGGATGGAFAGVGWGLLWHYFCTGRPGTHRYGNAWTVLAITMGIAFGGLTGYGVFISWLNGRFNLAYPVDYLPIWPGWGYLALFCCGLHWGGVTGCFLAWTGAQRILDGKAWLTRIAFGFLGAFLAWRLVIACPQFFLPYWGDPCYSDPAFLKDTGRTIGTVRTIAWHLGLFLGFLAYECFRRDWGNVKLILTLAIGFALPFTLGGYWQTLHGSALRIDWWKNWEMTIGLGGGLAFGLAFHFFNRPEAEEGRWSCLYPNAERLLGYAFPLWLAGLIAASGALKSLCEHWGLERSPLLYTAFALLVFAPATLALFYSIHLTRRNPLERGVLTIPRPLKIRIFWLFQALLLLTGFTASIHPLKAMGRANYLLLTLYTCYTLGAVLAWFFCFKRHRPNE